MSSFWYELQITPTGGSLVNFFFKTAGAGGSDIEQRITGMFETPYNGDNILTPELGSPPTYNNSNGVITNMIFNSTFLADAYSGADPVQDPGGSSFTIDSGTPYTVVSNNGPMNQDVLITSTNDPACFNEGTQILCLNKELKDEYIKIEELRKGDLVKCYKYGYRRIDVIGKNAMINNPKKWISCMYKMSKTDENGLTEDLIVTGGHSILVDELGELKEESDRVFGGNSPMIDDKYLLLASVSKSFKKLENNNTYTYYHFVVENEGDDSKSYGVWANGVLTESTSKKYFSSQNFFILV